MHDRLRCPECRYELAGVPAVDGHVRCPECGEAFGSSPLPRFDSPTIRRHAWRVCAAPAVQPLVVALMLSCGADMSMFMVLVVPVLSAMISVLLFAVHAAGLCLPPRSTYRLELFLVGAAAHALSLVGCLLAVGVVFWNTALVT